MMRRTRALAALLFLGIHTSPSPSQQVAEPQRNRVVSGAAVAPSKVLGSHVPAWATAANDLDEVPGDQPLRLELVLTRSAERQAAYAQLLKDQQDPSSPVYHQWLTPQEVGSLYGPTEQDVAALTSWLESQGIDVLAMAPSRMFVTAEARTSVVSNALHTRFHRFRVDGALRRAPVSDPSLPTALMPIVAAISGLADVDIHPMVGWGSVAAEERSAVVQAQPRYTSATGSHYVTPNDFAVLFDVKSVYAAGFNGAGQKVAIIGRSRVAAADISGYETNTGLPSNVVNVVIPPTGVDPGMTANGDQAEATLDVQRVIGTAPGAQVDLVVSGTANGYNGIFVAAQYEVQTLRDPIMNISFGSCEVFAGASQVSLWDTLFAQAASEGISVFVSSADSGAATCDTQFATTPSYQFRSINYICSSSYATCVGATEFNDTTNPGQYWSNTNGSGLSSVTSYIPEGAWNEPNLGGAGTWAAVSGGGGASLLVPKPSWQTGTGVPADGARDVPDISFPGAAHDAYYACYASGGGDCSQGRFGYFYGTSCAAPTMAAVTALLNQKAGQAHGNLNPLLYRVAASSPSAFHDATPDSSGVSSCDVAVPSMCNNSTPGPASSRGGLAGFSLTAGYDQATGLGSLDVANFIAAVTASNTSTLAPTALAIVGAVSSITNTQTDTFTATLTSTTSGTPTGTVQFYLDTAVVGSPVPLSGAKASSGPVPFPAAGSHLVSARYAGDATFASAVSPGSPVNVSGLFSATRVSGAAAALVDSSPSYTATVAGVAGSAVPTGLVRFYLSGNGSAGYVATLPLANGSVVSPIMVPATGTYIVAAYYLGDAAYSPSSFSTALTVQKVPTITSVATTATHAGTGGSKVFTVSVNAAASGSSAPAPTGSIQLYANGVALGAPIAVPAAAGASVVITSPLETFSVAGTYAITASYTGDTLWQASTSGPASVAVDNQPASFSLSVLAPTLTVTAGQTGLLGGGVTVTGLESFAGSVSLGCTVTYNGSGTAANAPTCSLNPGSLTVNVDSAPSSASLTINSVSAHTIEGRLSSAAGEILQGAAKQVVLCAMIVWLILPRRRAWKPLLCVAALFGLQVATGCSKTSSPATVPGTTPGSYTVTVTGSTTAAGIASPQPVIIGLTVN